MSDELDPDLSRLFAQTQQPLPGADFEARLMRQLSHSQGVLSGRGWLSGYSLVAVVRAAWSGIATGLLAPFKLRPGYSTAMLITAAVLTVWMSLQPA
jgi:hypothetical protein